MKLKSIAVVAAVILVSSSLYAQQEAGATVSAVTASVSQVYPAAPGYWVIYQKSDLSPGQAFLPYEWFQSGGGKGELLEVDDAAAPYLMVFYSGGEFSHVRLVVQRNRSHRSWHVIPQGTDIDANFNPESLNFEY